MLDEPTAFWDVGSDAVPAGGVAPLAVEGTITSAMA